jgi:undecaprenyl-phosphate 4-deoxy-4-formamido-L-arabinose transferase
MANPSSPALSIVIPVYRSAVILPALIERLAGVLPKRYSSYEVILVDDASPDDTWQSIETLCQSYAWVKGVGLRTNAGQHGAIVAGLNHASGDVIVTMDDDLQHSPEDIPFLVDKIQEGHDVCYATFNSRHHERWKIWGSRFNNFVANILLKKPRDLYLSSFKAFHREIRNEIIKYQGPFPYVDGLILSVTRHIVSIEVEHHPRLEGKSNYSFVKLVRLWTHMATNFSILPLRVASYLGIAFSIAGFVLAIVLVVARLSSAEIPVGWTSLAVAILVIGGIQLLALGAIGEYLGRAFLVLNRQPQFVVRRKRNFPMEQEQ